MARVGMDATVVRRDADQMDRVAEQLHVLLGSINAHIGRMHAGWFGADAEQLIHRWRQQSRPAIEAIAVHVHHLAVTARNEAHAQDVTSGSEGSAGGADPRHFVGWAGTGDALNPITRGLASGLPAGAAGLYQLWSKGRSWDSSGHARAEWSGGARGSTHLGVVPVSGDVSARAWAEGSYKTHVGVTRDGAEASASAAVGVGVAVAANGMIGNKYASVAGHVDAAVEARAGVDGKVHVGRDGASTHVGGSAYAGAHVDASAHGEVAGVGAGAGVHGYAGIGVKAEADAHVTLHEVRASVTLGAALGLGGGVTVSVDVKPERVLGEIQHIHLWN